MEGKMDKDFKDIPLSESQVSLKLAEIHSLCLVFLFYSVDMVVL